MTSKDYLKQIAESKGVCPLTNEVKDNALLFPIGFEKIFQDLDRLEELEKALEIIKNKKVNLFHIWAFDDYEQYKEHYPFSEYNAREDMLTNKEFDFLKEWL